MRGTMRHATARRALAIALLAAPIVVGLGLATRGAFLDPSRPAPAATSFFGTMLLAALHGLGLDLDMLRRGLPLVCWSGSIAVLIVHAVRAPVGPWPAAAAGAGRAQPHPALLLPVAAWGVALHRDLRLQAAGHLEASLFACLVVGGMLLLVNHPRRTGLAAAAYALAVLVRPEAGLDSIVVLAYVLWRGGARRAGRFAAVWAGLVAPYFVWRWIDPSAGAGAAGSAPAGWADVAAAFRAHPLQLACGAGALGGWIASRARRPGRDPRLDLGLVALAHVAVTVVVAARRDAPAAALLPAMPLLYLAAEEMVRTTGRRVVVIALAVLVVTGSLRGW